MFHSKVIERDVAELAWQGTPNAPLFCSPTLLDMLNCHPLCIGGFKNKELLVIWPLASIGSDYSSPPVFSYYFGPYWVSSQFSSVPYKYFKNNLEALNCLIPIVKSLAPKLSFSLAPNFVDLRPFLWWGYGGEKRNQFILDLRYTAIYQFPRKYSEEEIIQSFRADDKRKKLRKILKENIFKSSFGPSNDIDFYLELYISTIQRSGQSPAPEEISYLRNFINLTKISFSDSISVKLIEIFIGSRREVCGFQLLLAGKNTAYAIAQCTTDEAR